MHCDISCHRVKAVQYFLADYSLATLDWPENRPDLYHIENPWKIIKYKVADKKPSNAEALNQAIKKQGKRNFSRLL